MVERRRYYNSRFINFYGGVAMFLYFFFRYATGLLAGIVFGLVYPASASMWSLLVLLGIIAINEFIGRWGFGSHWNGYRFTSYALYTGFAVCIWVGIQFGSGNIGTLLITVGERIS